MVLLGSYVYSTTNTLDTIEAFIAETYVQLVATESKCYSTICSTLQESVLANAPMKDVCLTAPAVLFGALYSCLCRH